MKKQIKKEIVKQTISKLKEEKKLYVVIYKNNNLGNKDLLEVIVENEQQFKEWLKELNENRRMDYISDDDFIEEKEEEFELKPLVFWKKNNN